MAFIPGERLNGVHTVDFLIWRIHQAQFIAPLIFFLEKIIHRIGIIVMVFSADNRKQTTENLP